VTADDDGWVVRPVAGADATKDYRCPGCDHVLLAGTPHVVVWRADLVDERRHWHTPCWRRRVPGRTRY
jgi:hypothetical protein